MQQTHASNLSREQETTTLVREEPKPRPRLQLEALEPRLAPTNSPGGTPPFPGL